MQVPWNKLIAEINAEAESYLLAVSGGVDSIFMLEFMARNSSVPFHVAHFNHGLREQSAEEEALVRATCARLAVDLHVGHGDPDKMRSAKSLEAEARDQRYAYFETVRRQGEVLMTAHHANDQLETTLIRLMRGYPHDSLRIHRRTGDRFRPFLEVPKEDIVLQATRRRYVWLEDQSNEDQVHERNWVRHTVIPEMMKRRDVLRSIVFTSQGRRSSAQGNALAASLDSEVSNFPATP